MRSARQAPTIEEGRERILSRPEGRRSDKVQGDCAEGELSCGDWVDILPDVGKERGWCSNRSGSLSLDLCLPRRLTSARLLPLLCLPKCTPPDAPELFQVTLTGDRVPAARRVWLTARPHPLGQRPLTTLSLNVSPSLSLDMYPNLTGR